MRTKTAQEWVTEYEQAIRTLRETKNVTRNNNNSNDIRKYRIAIAYLQSVPATWTLNMKIDGVKLNKQQDDFTIGNNGVLAEQIIRWHIRKHKVHNEEKRQAGKADIITRDSGDFEVKTGMSCRWIPTKSQKKKDGTHPTTILANSCGIFELTPEQVEANLKNGRLPYNKVVGSRTERTRQLEKILGLW